MLRRNGFREAAFQAAVCQVFSSMLDEVRRGCPAQETVQVRVLSTSVVDKFQELMSSDQSPLCLFPTRQSCHDFNSDMLTKLDSELNEIKCVDEVDETKGTFEWSKKATKAMEKLNRDCNMTGGLEAVLKVAVGARIMLRRNIDTGSGLVNGALGTVTAIRTHHVTVEFDGRQQPYRVERVKGRFLVLKNIYVQRKQFPLTLAFAVTIHKCQGLSLDCAVMDLSKQVFCAGMAYVALSHVKEMQNLHLIAFDEEAIKVSGKSLEELNRLRQTYRPDLQLHAVPSPEKKPMSQTRKRKMSGTVDKRFPSPKKQRKSRKRKVDVKSVQPPPTKVTASRQPRPQKQGEAAKVLPSKPTAGKKRKLDSAEQLSKRKGNFVYVGPRKDIPRQLRYNPVSPDWQRQACQQLGLRFVSDNGSAPCGPNVPLAYPACGKKIQGDGNCLFRALCYVVTGSERQHFRLRSVIVEHIRSLAQSVHGLYLEGNLMMQENLEEYLVQSDMQCNGVWGTDVEVVVAAHLLDVNIAMFNVPVGDYVVRGTWLVNHAQPMDNTRPTMYISYTGNHFDVILSQE